MAVGMAVKMKAEPRGSIYGDGEGWWHARWRQLLAAFLVSLQAMCAGAVVGWDPVDAGDGSWLPSVATLGTVVGAAPAGTLADLLGRRTVLAAAAAPGVAGWSLVAAAACTSGQTTMLYAGRFASGVSAGAILVTVPMYNCEVASGIFRGAVGSLQYLVFATGVAWSRALAFYEPPLWLPSIAAASHALSVLALLLVPESPTFLAHRGRTAEAEAALARLGAADPPRGARELGDLVGDRPAVPRLLRVGIIAVGLVMFREMVGARAVAVLSRMVFPTSWSAVCPPTLALAVAAVLGAVVPVASGDAVGRKALLMCSGAAMAVCHLALSVYLFVRVAHPGQDLSGVAWLPVVSALAHAAAFGAGFGPLAWLVVCEVAPPAVRGPVVSLAACADRMLALVFTRAFYGSPEPVQQHPVLSLVFCCSCCLGVLFVVLYVPETRRRSLREVQRLLK